MKEPIKLVVHRIPKGEIAGHIRVTEPAEQVLRELRAATGLSIRQIASELIIQAAEQVEIVESE